MPRARSLEAPIEKRIADDVGVAFDQRKPVTAPLADGRSLRLCAPSFAPTTARRAPARRALYNAATVTQQLPDDTIADVRSSDGKVLLFALAVAIAGIAAVAGIVLFVASRAARPEGDDVGDRPEFAAVRAQLAGLEACSISYGQQVRGMRAEERRYGYLYVRECGERWLAVHVPVERADWQRGAAMELRRDSRSEPWSIYVDKRSVTLPAAVSALDRFAPILLARYPALLIEHRAAMSRARSYQEQLQHDQQRERERNASSWR